MSFRDLTSHSSQMIHHPLSIEFEGLIVYQCPPNGSGITVLIALGIIKALEQQQPPINGHHYISLRNMQHNSALYLHTLIEILRLSFADTLHHVCDPQTFSAPHLLSPEYLASRALLVNQTSVNRNLAHGSPIASSDTV